MVTVKSEYLFIFQIFNIMNRNWAQNSLSKKNNVVLFKHELFKKLDEKKYTTKDETFNLN